MDCSSDSFSDCASTSSCDNDILNDCVGATVVPVPRGYFERSLFREQDARLFGPHIADHLRKFYKYWHAKYPEGVKRNDANKQLMESPESAMRVCRHWLQDEIRDAIIINTGEEKDLALALYWGLSPDVIRIPTSHRAWTCMEDYLCRNDYGFVELDEALPSSILGGDRHSLVAIQNPPPAVGAWPERSGLLVGVFPWGYRYVNAPKSCTRRDTERKLKSVQCLLTNPDVNLDTNHVDSLVTGLLRTECQEIRDRDFPGLANDGDDSCDSDSCVSDSCVSDSDSSIQEGEDPLPLRQDGDHEPTGLMMFSGTLTNAVGWVYGCVSNCVDVGLSLSWSVFLKLLEWRNGV